MFNSDKYALKYVTYSLAYSYIKRTAIYTENSHVSTKKVKKYILKNAGLLHGRSKICKKIVTF